MPEIRIKFRPQPGPKALTDEEVRALVDSLRDDCAERFSLNEHPLTRYDFDVYPEPLTPLSAQRYDVIVRIVLHNYETRVLGGDSNAEDIAVSVWKMLNTDRMVECYGRRSVGVSLVFAEVAWAAAA